jgi:3-phenylpropionate/trans-cinnamate dioxygenase ferredoxin reductase subunit
MTPDRTLVIVGACLAGAKAAEGARTTGYDGRVVLVGDEEELPYERPPLSKAVLRGDEEPETARVHDATFYAANDIELLLGRRVVSLDPTERKVHLDSNDTIAYTSAVVATGAAPRHMDIPGNDLAGVRYLRTIGEANRLGDAIRSAGRIAVIGAGWIGSEVAASARQMGAEVVLIAPSPVPLRGVLGDQIGEVFRRLHADNGVELRLGSRAVELRGTGAVEQVVLDNGAVETTGLVVVGIGVTPRVDLADAAGLKVANGIVVDEQLRSSAPGVYAAGDVASAWHPRYSRHLRIEHWANALNQGLAAGANAAGDRQSYTRLPYFFSDQYDLGLEYVGLGDLGDAVVVRGSLTDREFIAFWHRGGSVTAAMNVNVWDVVEDLKGIVAPGHPIDLERLADPDVPLAELA